MSTTSRAPSWTLGQRLELAGYVLLAVGAGVLAIVNALQRQWSWLLLTLALAVVAAGALLKALRRASPAARAAAQQHARDADSAVRAMSAERVLALARQHRLDVDTSAGQIALIRVLREAEPRLSLVQATTLVDAVRR
ncbi:hypothetical protein [Kineococcus sp. SYSU DK005]|uniref:hypothetical protein n=1 Tax=Kineococcus sp. SYSU DK005 TaxID=3383126 RepID=UPI003D7D2217